MTNGGWTSLTAMSTSSTGYVRNGTNPSGDLVTSNASAFSALAALSTQQIVNYSVSFNGAGNTYTCPYSPGEYVGGNCSINYDSSCTASEPVTETIWYGMTWDPSTLNYVCPETNYEQFCRDRAWGWFAGSTSAGGGMCGIACGMSSSCGFYGSWNPDCVVSIRFLNSANGTISTPINGAASVSTAGASLTTNVGASGVNAIRKIQTQTSCSGSGANLSGGANFSSATKFK
jgi:hypothetical protein